MPVPYKCLECASNLQLKLIFDEDILRFDSCKVCKDKEEKLIEKIEKTPKEVDLQSFVYNENKVSNSSSFSFLVLSKKNLSNSKLLLFYITFMQIFCKLTKKIIY